MGRLRLLGVVGAAALVLLPAPLRAANGDLPPGKDVGTDWVTSMVLDPGHRQVFLDEANAGLVKVYSYRLRHLKTIRLPRPGPGQLALSGKGRFVYVVSSHVVQNNVVGSIVAIRTDTLRIAWRMPAPAHWDPGDRCLEGVAAASGRVWSVGHCTPEGRLFSFDPKHRDRGWASAHAPADMNWLTTAPDNHKLLAGIRTDETDSGVAVWRLVDSRAKLLGLVEGSGDFQSDVMFTADGGEFVYNENDADSPPYGIEVRRTAHLDQPGPIYAGRNDYNRALALSPTGRHIVKAADRIQIFAAGNATPVRTIDPAPGDSEGSVYTGDLLVTPSGHTMFDVIFTNETEPDGSCCPPHFLLQRHHLAFNTW
jgi:hypothetical protein